MIHIKRKFNNGIENCLEIYSEGFKIIDKTKNQKWNTTFDVPITITQNRVDDYVETEELIDEIVLSTEE